jgi:hypothetical protein
MVDVASVRAIDDAHTTTTRDETFQTFVLFCPQRQHINHAFARARANA